MWRYDPNGNGLNFRRTSTRVAGYGGTINAYTYETANRLATVGDGTNSATYTYLANSKLVSQILYKQNTTTRMTTTKQYDFLNRLEWINSTLSGANTAPFYYGYIYNDANQRTRMATADGSYWVYGYDSLGQVTSGKKYWGDGVPVEGVQNEYVFDDIGNRKSTKEGGDQFGQNLRSASYTNNTLNQITGRGVPGYANIIGSSTAANTVTVNGSNADYRRGSFYREELAISNSATNPVWTAVTVSADTTKTGNILTPPSGQTFWYDADGNLTNDLVRRYIWDGENRLVEVQPLTNAPADSKKWLTFSYDWHGRRIAKTAKWWTNSAWTTRTSNRFLYDGWSLIGELNATNNNLIRGYIWGLDLTGAVQGIGGVGALIAINDIGNGSHFAAFDGNGNVMGCTKSDGSVAAQYEYDPFGQTLRETGDYSLLNPVRFSTRNHDTETDLFYNGRTYLDGKNGRSLSRDEAAGENAYGFDNYDEVNSNDNGRYSASKTKKPKKPKIPVPDLPPYPVNNKDWKDPNTGRFCKSPLPKTSPGIGVPPSPISGPPDAAPDPGDLIEQITQGVAYISYIYWYDKAVSDCWKHTLRNHCGFKCCFINLKYSRSGLAPAVVNEGSGRVVNGKCPKANCNGISSIDSLFFALPW
jgi:RHS repeat-associated protein